MQKRKILNTLYYTSGALIIGYLIVSIGIREIITTIAHTDILLLISAVGVTLIASAVRIIKLHSILKNISFIDIFNIFIFSRLGKELSFAGYFIPLAKKDFRKTEIAENLIIDRYTEIFATLFIGFACSLFYIQADLIYYLILTTLACVFIGAIIFPFVPLHKLKSRIKIISKILTSVTNIQSKLSFNKAWLTIFIYSVVSTILDFYVVYLIITSFNVSLNPMLIPIIWASSALVSIAFFIIMGTTEVAMIYLYERYAMLSNKVILSYIIVSRVVNFLSILIMALTYYLLELYLKFKSTKYNGSTSKG